MAGDREGVRVPRLRPADVARRGIVFGLLGVVPLVLVTMSISDHSDREEFLAVFSVLAIFGAFFLVVGTGFWWLSKEDIRRLRDWSTITTQAASVTIIGPTFLRSGLCLLVLGAAAFGLYHLVDAAPYDSWLYE
ncbi:hypothetical protein HTV80_15595 [Streptomyces sp. Vc74B-19]|uniref:DUF6336 family protein n=1 Tax=unclassified Streptomyces TaxID=2593676 RepID=UPI001BFC8E3F|nr:MULTISPECIES: DUF6336 family protein [unclassified Streptomyces]MBT3164521.1 hypothetical protein [Streptomyces sp. Vc74B-19]MDU0300501.1 DUF6336 family protein [Streptomyces sp. PAL114]